MILGRSIALLPMITDFNSSFLSWDTVLFVKLIAFQIILHNTKLNNSEMFILEKGEFRLQ